MSLAAETLAALGPVVGRLRDTLLLRESLKAMPPTVLRAARELAGEHLLNECGYCLDERNRCQTIDRWTLDYMREVALAAEVIERVEAGKYVVRVTNIAIAEPKPVTNRKRAMAAASEPREIDEEQADGIV